jgi:hypothetical protein
MRNEQVINKLKGISSILSNMSESAPGSIQWNEHALILLNDELTECIDVLEQE